MNTREIATEYRLSKWAQVVQERSASGLCIREYCRSKQIKEYVYCYWQRMLREAACRELALQTGMFSFAFTTENSPFGGKAADTGKNEGAAAPSCIPGAEHAVVNGLT